VRRILWNPGWLLRTLSPGRTSDVLRGRPTGSIPSSALREPAYRRFHRRGGRRGGGLARTQFHKNENRLYLASLYLLPAFQGRGLAGGCSGGEEKALAYGLPGDLGRGDVQNEAARGFRKTGFRSSGGPVALSDPRPVPGGPGSLFHRHTAAGAAWKWR